MKTPTRHETPLFGFSRAKPKFYNPAPSEQFAWEFWQLETRGKRPGLDVRDGLDSLALFRLDCEELAELGKKLR